MAGDLALPGKPSPEMFVRAASELAPTSPARAVVEDALSGVEPGKAGAFGLVVGVDRGAGADRLAAPGPTLW